jgi:ABC exporter DevB family membrane fusion protein
MNRRLPHLVLSIAALALAACGGDVAEPAKPTIERSAPISAAGLVEPFGEERVLIPEIGGRLKRVLIDEGDVVKAGQVLAEVENGDYAARVAQAAAHVTLREAELAKLRQGARPQERREAEAALAEAEAAAVLARNELARRRSMFDKQQISREVVDQAEANHRAAEARRDGALARAELVRIGARAEDLTIAEAALAAAQAEHEQAKAAFEKTVIRAPVDGIVLKRDLREGETVVALSPIPLARIGDMSRLYVRADIDELDIGRVVVGQVAHVVSDAFPGQQFTGKVVRVAQRMGRKNSVSENPSEKTDVKILEAQIEMDENVKLPIGLRVDVRIDVR